MEWRRGGAGLAGGGRLLGLAGRYIWGVPVIGRGRELREAGRLLDRAAGGAGGLLTFVGASGVGQDRAGGGGGG